LIGAMVSMGLKTFGERNRIERWLRKLKETPTT
jgi:hypothetical protein